MGESVVVVAKCREVAEVGGSTAVPWDDVVSDAPVMWDVATGEDASLVAHQECPALGGSREALIAADRQGIAGQVDDDPFEVLVTAQFLHPVDRDLVALLA